MSKPQHAARHRLDKNPMAQMRTALELARADGFAAGQSEAGAIAIACIAAGKPELAPELIIAGASVAEANAVLQGVALPVEPAVGQVRPVVTSAAASDGWDKAFAAVHAATASEAAAPGDKGWDAAFARVRGGARP
jgi:hypothetical protein